MAKYDAGPFDDGAASADATRTYEAGIAALEAAESAAKRGTR